MKVKKVVNNTEVGEVVCGCNTCEEVKQQYIKKSWKFVPTTVDQCRGELLSDEQQRVLTEGCQVYGYLEVNRVGGSFHIAPGKSFSLPPPGQASPF